MTRERAAGCLTDPDPRNVQELSLQRLISLACFSRRHSPFLHVDS